MAAELCDITIDQGATFALPIQYVDSAGVPVNLSGYDARAQVRTAYADQGGTVLIDVSLDPSLAAAGTGIAFTDATAGELVMQISATDTTGMPTGAWVWDLEVESGDGVVTRLLGGRAMVSPEVTR